MRAHMRAHLRAHLRAPMIMRAYKSSRAHMRAHICINEGTQLEHSRAHMRDHMRAHIAAAFEGTHLREHSWSCTRGHA